jgi:hypothetical protein
VTFVRPDRWLKGFERVDPDGAGREVVRRFLATYGPATADDFARWIGIRGTQPKRMLAALGDETIEVDVEGRAATLLASDLEMLTAAGPPDGVRLLPAFDPYVVGTRPRDHLVAQCHELKIYRAQGWISPVLLVDGRMAGVWKQERRPGRVVVRIEPFGALPKWARAKAEAEAARLAGFLEGELDLGWGAL